MFQFQVSTDGQIREASVHDAVTSLKQLFPDLDPLALEATMMLERAHALMLDARAAYWSRSGITAKRFILLRHLYLAEGKRLSMGEIAAVLDAGTPNVTQFVAGLVRDGLVYRTTAEDDKRVVYAVLSPKGEGVFETVFTQNAARLKDSWNPFSDREKQMMISLLARLRIHLLSRQEEGDARDLASFASVAALPEERDPGSRSRRRQERTQRQGPHQVA